MLEYLIPSEAMQLTHTDFRRFRRNRPLRRWTSTQDARPLGHAAGFGGSLGVLAGLLVDTAARALGVPGTVAIVLAVLVAVAGFAAALSLATQQIHSVEGFAPPPGTATDVDATPIAVTLGDRKHQLKLGAGVAGDLIRPG